MPELPDVETFRRRLYRRGLKRRVLGVGVRRNDLLVDIDAKSLARALEGHVLETTRRHGKHLFARASDHAGWLRLHFGMTGELGVAGAGADPARMPPGFILPDRREGAPCPRCGGALARLRVSGRTAYVCPACQKAA